MTSKSVAQIRAEWQAIKAHRPGGLLPNVVDFLRRLAQLPLGRLTRRDEKAVEIIDVLHEAVKGYQAEVGVLLARLDELDPPDDWTRRTTSLRACLTWRSRTGWRAVRPARTPEGPGGTLPGPGTAAVCDSLVGGAPG